MKIKLLNEYDGLPKGIIGEAISWRVTSNSVVFTCVFYGRTGVHLVDVRDARPLTES